MSHIFNDMQQKDVITVDDVIALAFCFGWEGNCRPYTRKQAADGLAHRIAPR